MGATLHVCADEAPTWAELVACLAEELRAQGAHISLYLPTSPYISLHLPEQLRAQGAPTMHGCALP